MKHLALAFFVLWFLSLHFYLSLPAGLSIVRGVAFARTCTVAVLEWFSRRGTLEGNDGGGSLGL